MSQTVSLGESIHASVENARLEGAVSGHRLNSVILEGDSTAYVTQSGTITPRDASICDGQTDVTANYTITYKSGALTVNRTAAYVTSAPGEMDLVYNGAKQKLVTEGKAAGGTLRYGLGTETKAPDTYSTSIPEASLAGTYYVWYMVAGDMNHTDSSPPVTIRKAELTEVILSHTVRCLDNGSQSVVVRAVKAGNLTVPSECYSLKYTTSGGTETCLEQGKFTITVNSADTYTVTAEAIEDRQ